MIPASLYLVVARGRDAGARVLLGEAPRVIGRGRDADLVLLDRRVSRRHLSARADGDGAHLQVLDGASDFVANGAARAEGHVAVGETVVIGDSALVLTRVTEGVATGARSTEVGALMTGLGADVRGLAAAIELVDALDGVDEEGDIQGALEGWAKAHLGALGVALLVDQAIDEELAQAEVGARRVVERDGTAPQTVVLAAPAPGSVPAWIAVTCAIAPPATVTDTTRRLVVVAARLCGSALARARSLRATRVDRESFRRVAVGSARSFLGESGPAREVAKLAARLASSEVTVLLEGETGTGKTFLARILHESGSRASEPLHVLNCAAIPETLIESELFGHERGAFTGATSPKPGALEAAGRGTLLLDEIGELPLASQAKLLRVLEDRRFERLGSNRPLRLDARVLVATNRDLPAMVAAGTFRADLFYRIAVVKLRVPPLRERGEDLALLAERILADLAPSTGRRVRGFSADAMDAIRRYPWPGNVRELRNAIERALAVGEGTTIEACDLPVLDVAPPPPPGDEALVRLPAKLEWLEERAIDAALRATGGNQRRAALLLGINRVTLHRKLRAIDGGD